MKCRQKTNLKNCNCSFECERKGICCECISYHRERGELPACYFSKESEKSGDRSIKKFLKEKSK
ncbi:MAG: DUF6485 family protein [archaeon]